MTCLDSVSGRGGSQPALWYVMGDQSRAVDVTQMDFRLCCSCP